MFVKTDKATIECASCSGQALLQYQQYKAKQQGAAIEKGQNYATEALGGFIQPVVNAPINIHNGVSEPFRAGERALFGTSNIPEISRMTVAEKIEYGNKDGRQMINRGSEIGATIAMGGAMGGKAIATQADRIFLGTESAYNMLMQETAFLKKNATVFKTIVLIFESRLLKIPVREFFV